MNYIQSIRKYVGHQPLIMTCACVLIEDGKGNLLLQKRVDDSKWGYHGGAVELNEKVEEAARREVKEELGIELGEMRLFGIYSGPEYFHIYPNGDEVSCIDIVYLCSEYTGQIQYQESEVSETGWFNKESVPNNLSNNPKTAIFEYFQ